jgi:hypothetical protein
MCRTKKAPRGALDYFMAGGEGAVILQSEQFDARLNPDKHDNEALQVIIEQCSAGGMSVARLALRSTVAGWGSEMR